MELLITLGAGLAVAIISIELYAWLPRLNDKLLDLAASRVPEHERERWREEWHGHLAELPNSLRALLFSIGINIAAIKIGLESRISPKLVANRPLRKQSNQIDSRIIIKLSSIEVKERWFRWIAYLAGAVSAATASWFGW